jgi:hypothetical protein
MKRKPKVTLKDRLDTALGQGYRQGYAAGLTVANEAAAEREAAGSHKKELLEAQIKLMNAVGQTIQAVAATLGESPRL